MDPSFRRIGDAQPSRIATIEFDDVAGRQQWNLEDDGVALRKLTGIVLLAFGLAEFITVPRRWNFVRTDGGSSTDDAGYYSLLIDHDTSDNYFRLPQLALSLLLQDRLIE